MNDSFANKDLQTAAEFLRSRRLAEALDLLERVPPEGAEGELATEWLAGIYLWNGQDTTARAAISQRTVGTLTQPLRVKMAQAYMLEGMPMRAHDTLLTIRPSNKNAEWELTAASIEASIGNYRYALSCLENVPHDKVGPERWLLDPSFQTLWQHVANNEAPPELLAALSMLDEAAGFSTIRNKMGRPMEFGIFSRNDLSPKYCPIFELDIPNGVARINPASCHHHPVLFAEFLTWSTLRIEENLSRISSSITASPRALIEMEFAKIYAAAGRYDKSRTAVLGAAIKEPRIIEEALESACVFPVVGAVRDMQHCRDTRSDALDELISVEKLCNAGEPERALAILDNLRSATGELTLLTLKGAIAHFLAGNYEQAIELANVVTDQWPDDPVAWMIAAGSFRNIAQLEDAADILLSAPPNILQLGQARQLASDLRGFGHGIPLFEFLNLQRPLTDDLTPGAPDAFYAVGVLSSTDSLKPAKYFLGSFPSQAAAVYECRQFLRQTLWTIHAEGMDRDELLLWAERLAVSAYTIPASPFCPRADIRDAAEEVAGPCLSDNPNQTTSP